jgi:hypothetical protein
MNCACGIHLCDRIPANRPSTRSSASWRRAACYRQSTSARAASRPIRSSTTASPRRSTRTLQAPSGVTPVRLSPSPLANKLSGCRRRSCAPAARRGNWIRHAARDAALQVARRARAQRRQQAAPHGTDGRARERRVLRRARAQDARCQGHCPGRGERHRRGVRYPRVPQRPERVRVQVRFHFPRLRFDANI